MGFPIRSARGRLRVIFCGRFARSRSCGPCGLVLPVLRIVQGVGPKGRKALDGLPGCNAAPLAVGVALPVTLCGSGGPVALAAVLIRCGCLLPLLVALCGPVAASAALSVPLSLRGAAPGRARAVFEGCPAGTAEPLSCGLSGPLWPCR